MYSFPCSVIGLIRTGVICFTTPGRFAFRLVACSCLMFGWSTCDESVVTRIDEGSGCSSTGLYLAGRSMQVDCGFPCQDIFLPLHLFCDG